MSFVEREPIELAHAFAEKLAEEFSDDLDDICARLDCECDDEDHGMIIVTWGQYIEALRNFDGAFRSEDQPSAYIFNEMGTEILMFAFETDQDPLEVIREHTFRLDE